MDIQVLVDDINQKINDVDILIASESEWNAKLQSDDTINTIKAYTANMQNELLVNKFKQLDDACLQFFETWTKYMQLRIDNCYIVDNGYSGESSHAIAALQQLDHISNDADDVGD